MTHPNDAPERIFARPVGAVRDWTQWDCGPWALDDPYKTSVEYVRADCVETLEAERDALIQDLASYQEMEAELLSEIDRLKAERDLMAKKLELSEAMMDDRLAQMAHQFAKQMGKL